MNSFRKLSLFILLTNFSLLPLLVAKPLKEFGMEMGSLSSDMGKVRIPYSTVLNFFGYYKTNTKPDTTNDSRKNYSVYFFMPSDITNIKELGIRVISPWTSNTLYPDLKKGDSVASNFFENVKDTTNYFDPLLILERSTLTYSRDVTNSKVQSTPWYPLNYNDDDNELPAQPSGLRLNASLRILNLNEKATILSNGLYRIVLSGGKGSDVQGSFLLQLGFSKKVTNVLLGNDLNEMSKQLIAREPRKY